MLYQLSYTRMYQNKYQLNIPEKTRQGNGCSILSLLLICYNRCITHSNFISMAIIFTIGQVLFGGFFLYSGLKHFKQLGGMAGYAASKKVPFPKFAVGLTGAMLILGGLGIIFNFMPAIALILVSIFLVATSFTMHNFWRETDPMAKQMQVIQFTKNMALLGASLMLFGFLWI
jgi:putative oxidoreductase